MVSYYRTPLATPFMHAYIIISIEMFGVYNVLELYAITFADLRFSGLTKD